MILLFLALAIPPRAQQLTNVFENGTPAANYRYVKRLGDGRGFTCGRIGFTTATGDALEVIEQLTKKRRSNALARFLPTLRHLAARESGATSCLRGFERSWKTEARQSDFRHIQDETAFRLYGVPALRYANRVGVRSVLGIECLFDSALQHGDGEDPDGLAALVRETASRSGTPSGRTLGGRKCATTSEAHFIEQFLSIRMAHLNHAHDPKTRGVWADSSDRCHALANLARTKNFNLKTPFVVRSRDFYALIK